MAASADRPGPDDRHRGREGRGLGQAKRRFDMATIGTFKKTGSEYVGEIVTLSVQAKAVRIVPEDSTPNAVTVWWPVRLLLGWPLTYLNP